MTLPYLPDLVWRPAGAAAERVAVAGPDGELTYRQLWDRVAATSARLIESGIAAGDRIGLHFHRSAEYVTSLLATLGVGAVAVPLDRELPAGRVAQLLAAARPRLVLHAGGVPPAAIAGPDVGTAGRARPPEESPALILFTSGSTGQPKGVVLHHGGLANRLLWGHRWFDFTAGDRVLHKASIGFDASVHEIFAPLIAGGTVVIAPPGLQFDSLGLVRLIRAAGVTTAHFVPTMLRHVLDEPELAACTDLRRVLCGGEALDMALVHRLRSTLPCRLYNGYGPTETSINVTYWDCAEPYDGPIAPIGRPIAGADVEVLGDDLGPVPPGEAGELWISGVPVALGYLDGEANAHGGFQATGAGRRYRTGDLVRLAPAGYLEFRGRVDDQVKIRGVRVEPGEVGAALRRHPAVRDAAVVVASDSGAERWLVGYVVVDPRESPVVSGFARVPLPNGMAVASPSPDEALFLYRQIFDHAEYSRFGVRPGDGAVVVDIGANIGLFSLWASRQARDVRLVAVEPNPDTIPYLRANLGLYAPDADLVEAAVTDRAGTAELTSFPELTYLSGLGQRQEAASELVLSHHDRAGAAATEAERAALLADVRRRLDAVTHVVPTITLPDLFRRLGLDRVDLLKINAEGAELSILRGLGPEHWPRVAQVCLEVERASVAGPEIRAMLAAAGFEVNEAGDWNLGAGADVSYVYATRPDARPAPGRLADAVADRLLTAGALREHLASFLPDAMLPEQIVFVERLPRLPNGKLARLELPAPPPRTNPGPLVAASGAGLEDSLREAWRTALGVDSVRDDDNFLALGGHSLTALRVSVQVREAVGLEISPASCLRASTFSDWLGRAAGRSDRTR
jgi:amino acid adenylation domain-containing protein/FkbM family methyltransferase